MLAITKIQNRYNKKSNILFFRSLFAVEKMFAEISPEEREDLLEFFAEFVKIPADVAMQQVSFGEK